MNLSPFFGYARERYRIMLRRQVGDEPPWTNDPVLRDFYFCNIFREDDRTTVWFRENIREPLAHLGSEVLIATIAFRFFNLISTGEYMKDVLVQHGWRRKIIEGRLRGKAPLVTGAFVVKSPPGQKKLPGLCDCIDWADKARFVLADEIQQAGTLEAAQAELRKVPYLGPFMAYEIVTDLRHTCLLDRAPDIDKWASAGPGCAAGLRWITGWREKYTSAAGQERMLALMRRILEASRRQRNWPATWPRWELREVEHTLCEYDKWKRGHEGKRLKRRYGKEATKDAGDQGPERPSGVAGGVPPA